jgi:hypothetical protein
MPCITGPLWSALVNVGEGNATAGEPELCAWVKVGAAALTHTYKGFDTTWMPWQTMSCTALPHQPSSVA